MRLPIVPSSLGGFPPANVEEKRGTHMAKILVLYYSSYGHIEMMANAVAEGAGAWTNSGR
jgi:hypothetical protein